MQNGAGAPHILESALSMVRFDVYSTSRIYDHMYLEAFPNGVERAFENAVVQRQAADPEPLDTCLPESFSEVRTSKSRIAVLVEFVTLADDLRVWRKVEIRAESCALRALHTMWRPRAAALFETDVAGGMPVSRYINRNLALLCLFNPTIQHRHDLIAFVHSKGAARAKVILHINDEQCIS
jgi:hypothetical protein